jgi:uncharacterized protein
LTASPERVVLDTNVLVSALLNSRGAPGRVLDLVLAGEIVVAHDDRILSEWRDVLGREKFGFTRRDVEALLEFFEDEGLGFTPLPIGIELPDPDDAPFLEVAHAARATIVTGNLKHYPPETRQGVEVMLPAEFLGRWTADTEKPEVNEGGDEDG